MAFLRGMNLGRRRITNEALVAAVESLGFGEVSAYQASGNVLFDSGGRPDLEATLSEGLTESLGYDVRAYVRSAAEVASLAEATPFTEDELRGTRGKVQVTMLADVPDAARGTQAEALSTKTDRIRVSGAHWFWLPTGGISDSPLDFAAVERVLGIGTTRTHGTVQRIAKKLG
ncbi:MAG: DUF1697 domain-containing protein [Myxococcota bacterium]